MPRKENVPTDAERAERIRQLAREVRTDNDLASPNRASGTVVQLAKETPADFAAPTFNVRRAGPADVTEIHELIRRAYSGYVPMLGYQPGPMRRDYNVQLTKNPVWVAESDGKLAGLLELVLESDHVVVEDLAVDPLYQNRKLGRWFMDFAEQVARYNGLSIMRTYTNQRMDRNIAIYLRLGYQETHRAITEGIPRVFLEKRLQ